jgi:hypothetical protein
MSYSYRVGAPAREFANRKAMPYDIGIGVWKMGCKIRPDVTL